MLAAVTLKLALAPTTTAELLGCVFNTGGNVHGVQFGFVNNATSMRGLQLGLLNMTQTMHGLQVGVGNIIQKGKTPFLPIVNWSR